MDTGDFVIIVNAEKVALTGQKLEQKKACRHSGYPGGLKAVGYAELLEKNPVRAVEKAIRGMLPKNSLGRAQLKKLKAGPDTRTRLSSPRRTPSPRSPSNSGALDALEIRIHTKMAKIADQIETAPESYTTESTPSAAPTTPRSAQRVGFRRRPPQAGHRARAPRPGRRHHHGQRP